MSLAFKIQPGSSVPKYRQIANAIGRGIERQTIAREQQLPSINELSALYDISRDTAEKAYRLLKRKGMIISVRGKGYYASTSAAAGQRRMLLVFNKLSPYKEAIYDGFVRAAGPEASVDLQIYYEDIERFEQILAERTGQFTDYVIIPSFQGGDLIRARKAIEQHLSGQQVTLLDRPLPGLGLPHRAVIENFERDIYHALSQAHERLARYDRLKLYFPFDCHLSRDIIRGFQRYCLEHGLVAETVFKGFTERVPEPGTAYVVLRDEQLVTLVHQLKNAGLTAGHEVGILAYNDSPLKQVLLGGITVMTTRHTRMGERAAEMILNREWAVEENEFRYIERGSL